MKSPLQILDDFNKLSIPSENEIIGNWDMAEDTEPVVSIACISYNHGPYIEDAIRGFLIQKTKFPFEIIIHDDASTDKTADIIRKYEKRYPRLIKSILQKENLYSKGVRASWVYVYPACSGKYIAICEGDDYWVDVNKLQKQVDVLEDNLGIDLCFTSSIEQFLASGKKKYGYNYGDEQRHFDLAEIIRGGGSFMPTCTLLIRKRAVEQCSEFKPSPVGDFYLQIFGSLAGGAIYLPKATGVYRKEVPGSWSYRYLNKNLHDITNFTEAHLDSLCRLKKYCSEEKSISYAIAKKYIDAAKNIRAIEFNNKLIKYYTDLSWKNYSFINKSQFIYKIFSNNYFLLAIIHFFVDKLLKLKSLLKNDS